MFLGFPVADEFNDYLGQVIDRLRAEGVRAQLDVSDDRFPKKIRTHTKDKVPFMLIAGGEDRDANAVSFRYRDGSQENSIGVDAAVEKILTAIRNKAQV
jgi:threonyl-tRNA synthetase